MKNSTKNIQERQEKILSFLCEKKEMSISELSQALNVSEMTIRRDCSTLSLRGQINQKITKAHLNESMLASEVRPPNSLKMVRSYL